MASAALMTSSAVSPAALRSGSVATTSGRSSFVGNALPSLPMRASRAGVRMMAEKTDTPLPSTKQNVEAKNNERLLVFEDTPAGEFFRPEEERRPEFGNTSAVSAFKFDGPLPETVNGRLAMLGMAAAFLTELNTGMSVYEQLTIGNGAFWFLASAQVFVWASLVPIFKGESSDSRKFGPFTARAERWNGRLAMLGAVILLVVEGVKGGPVLF